jgi:hypothetical protein
MDAIGFYKQVLYSRFLYFVFPKRIIKLQRTREHLVEEIKYFTNKYIGEVDEKYTMNRVINDVEAEIDEGDALIRKNTHRKKKQHIHDEIDKFFINIKLIQGD